MYGSPLDQNQRACNGALLSKRSQAAGTAVPLHHFASAVRQVLVHLNAADTMVIKLKTAWPNTTTHAVMSPLECMQRLAALPCRQARPTHWPLRRFRDERTSDRCAATTPEL
jgi:hypothetical protein